MIEIKKDFFSGPKEKRIKEMVEMLEDLHEHKNELNEADATVAIDAAQTLGERLYEQLEYTKDFTPLEEIAIELLCNTLTLAHDKILEAMAVKQIEAVFSQQVDKDTKKKTKKRRVN